MREGGLKVQENQQQERDLVAAAQKDPRHFAELYELHFERVYAYVVRRVRDRSAAEELTAHVFHQALANLNKYKWRGAPFAAWLFRIASNSIADRANRSAREATLAYTENTTTNTQPDLEVVEMVARIYKLVAELPWDQRHVVCARFAEEKSIREVAQQLSRSEGAIKQLQFRALQNLRARLNQ